MIKFTHSSPRFLRLAGYDVTLPAPPSRGTVGDYNLACALCYSATLSTPTLGPIKKADVL